MCRSIILIISLLVLFRNCELSYSSREMDHTDFSRFDNLIDILNSGINLDENPEMSFNFLGTSEYVDDDEFSQLLSRDDECFFVLSSNIRGIRSKYDDLLLRLENFNSNGNSIAAITLQETHLLGSYGISHLEIPGYTCVYAYATATSKGGIATYIRNDLNFDIIKLPETSSNIWETIFVNISGDSLGGKKFTVGNVYRPPRERIELLDRFMSEFLNILDFLRGHQNVIIGGDFNLNLLSIPDDTRLHNFLLEIFTYDFFPKIVLPTRLSRFGGTLIDNFFCKVPDFSSIHAGILTTRLSDHQPYFVSTTLPGKRKKTVKYFNKHPSAKSKALFRSKISTTILTEKMDCSPDGDPDSNFEQLLSCIKSIKDETLIDKKVRFDKRKHPLNPWMTRAILTSINRRNSMYKKLKTFTGSLDKFIVLEHQLENFQKVLRNSIKLAKKDYNSRQIELNKDDPRKLWKIINNIVSPNIYEDNKTPNYFMINGHKIDDNKEIANAFNSFFSEIATKIVTDLGPPPENFFDYLDVPLASKFKFSPVTTNDVRKAIDSLKSKGTKDSDGLSTELIKSIKDQVLEPFTIIINQVIKKNKFPNALKIARVTAVFKKGDKHQLDNYRPISILPVFSKIIERIIHDQLTKYFIEHKILYTSQYGFRGGHSTELAAAEMIDKIMSTFVNRKCYLSIFMDLSKAFDCIDHDILLTKLTHYGISDEATTLLRSYLTDRVQYVKVGDSESGTLPVNIGVPQGSILGPLLFIVYINDIAKSSSLLQAILYADDSTFSTALDNPSMNTDQVSRKNNNSYAIHNSTNLTKNDTRDNNENIADPNSDSPFHESSALVNSELLKINKWLKSNRLSLNVKKTKYMVFHRSSGPQVKLSIGNSELERVENFNFLGLTLNEKLNWTPHLTTIARKIARGIGILKRLKPLLPSSSQKTLYYSLVHCHFQYQLLNWGYNCGIIEKFQKRAVRIICNEHYLAHSEPLMKSCNILKIKDLHNLTQIQFYHKYIHNQLPAYFTNINFPQNKDIHEKDTRNKNSLTNPRIRNDYAKLIPRNSIPALVNNLDDTFKDALQGELSITSIKRTYKYHVLNSYSSSHLCGIPGCYVCNVLYHV